jgi:hypothetical protein
MPTHNFHNPDEIGIYLAAWRTWSEADHAKGRPAPDGKSDMLLEWQLYYRVLEKREADAKYRDQTGAAAEASGENGNVFEPVLAKFPSEIVLAEHCAYELRQNSVWPGLVEPAHGAIDEHCRQAERCEGGERQQAQPDAEPENWQFESLLELGEATHSR